MKLSKFTEAAVFAARKHGAQKRKGKSGTPYINHTLDVADILCRIGGIEDLTVLIAAVLHDTLEDTDTTQEEIGELFGEEVLSLVKEVSDDRSLPRRERKLLQIEHAPHLSPNAKLIKIADKISNVRDIIGETPEDWNDAMVAEYIRFARKVVDGARGVNRKLEDCFDKVSGMQLENLE